MTYPTIQTLRLPAEISNLVKLNQTSFKSTNFAEKGQPTRASDFRRGKFSQATKMMRTVSNYVVYYRPQSFSFEPGIVPHRNSER